MTTAQYYFRTLTPFFFVGFLFPAVWLLKAMSLLILIAILYRGQLFIRYTRVVLPVLIIFTILLVLIGNNHFRGGQLCGEFFSDVAQETKVYEVPKIEMNTSEKFVRQLVNINSRSLSRMAIFQGESYCPQASINDILKGETKKLTQALPIYIASLVIIHGISFAVFRSRKVGVVASSGQAAASSSSI